MSREGALHVTRGRPFVPFLYIVIHKAAILIFIRSTIPNAGEVIAVVEWIEKSAGEYEVRVRNPAVHVTHVLIVCIHRYRYFKGGGGSTRRRQPQEETTPGGYKKRRT